VGKIQKIKENIVNIRNTHIIRLKHFVNLKKIKVKFDKITLPTNRWTTLLEVAPSK